MRKTDATVEQPPFLSLDFWTHLGVEWRLMMDRGGFRTASEVIRPNLLDVSGHCKDSLRSVSFNLLTFVSHPNFASD